MLLGFCAVKEWTAQLQDEWNQLSRNLQMVDIIDHHIQFKDSGKQGTQKACNLANSDVSL